ncbi:MAG: O-antigen ligase family protein [Kiritimatiellaeota bacterium]|nr:O-antigen ligase family protein [Kiritimatiellota bacterium]
MGFLGYSMVAIFVYGTPYEARVELLRALSLWLAYWAWANLGLAARHWRWVLGLLLLAAVANALFGLFNHFSGTPERVLWFNRLAEGVDYEQRISGTYFCPNHWANWLALLAPLALAVVLSAEAGILLRVLGAGALLTFPLAIHYSQSRAGLLGLVAGLIVTTLVLVWRRSRLWFALFLVLLPLLVAGGGYLYWKQSPIFRARVASALEEGKTGNGFRLNQWRDTLLMIQARPWFGHGAGGYGWAVEAYRQHMKDSDYQALYAHNDYLQSIAEYGAIGSALVALSLCWLLWKLAGALRRVTQRTDVLLLAGLLGAWAAALIHATCDFSLRIYANVATLAALTGLLAARLLGQGVWPSVLSRRAIACAGAVLAALLVGVMSWMLVSYYQNLRAMRALEAINYNQAEHCARLALRVDPANWYAAETLGQLLQTRAKWSVNERARLADAAVQAFTRAARGNRLNMETRFELGLALLAAGHAEDGFRLMRLAADTNPVNEYYRTQLGVQLRQNRRYAEALEAFRKSAKLAMNPTIRSNIEWLEADLKKQEASKGK